MLATDLQVLSIQSISIVFPKSDTPKSLAILRFISLGNHRYRHEAGRFILLQAFEGRTELIDLAVQQRKKHTSAALAAADLGSSPLASLPSVLPGPPIFGGGFDLAGACDCASTGRGACGCELPPPPTVWPSPRKLSSFDSLLKQFPMVKLGGEEWAGLHENWYGGVRFGSRGAQPQPRGKPGATSLFVCHIGRNE
jgi:hypothetical protein